MKIIKLETGFILEFQNRKLFEHSNTNPMFYVGNASEDVKMYRGNYKLSQDIVVRKSLEFLNLTESKDEIKANFSEDFCLRFVQNNDEVVVKIEQTSAYNRFWLRILADSEEKVFGLGEQMSYLNLRGRNFPIWTSEPGVGRDKSTYITWKSDVDAMAGGDYYNTNYPEPTFLSSQKYYFNLHSTAYSDFNFKNDQFHEVEVWQIHQSFVIQTADSYINLVEKISARFGRQPKLPEWVYQGVILGLQGGTDRMMELYQKTKSYDVDISGLWIQDWEGKKVTSFGKRLKWNWQWDQEMYPKLDEKIEQLGQEQVKVLGYINPYLLKDSPLYDEAYDLGYFATDFNDQDYLVDFGEFDCGVIDFTNPKAYDWYKELIKKEMIEFGLAGWMADFGEYLPTDLKLFEGDAMVEHNSWPVMWAKCNYDALVETNTLGEILYFMRAGGNKTQKYCPMLWAGDQSVDFTIHDGLASTIVAALSSGLVGNAYSHSDIGGYTSLYGNTRNKELFLRWAEMSAFTPVMRTHEGNRPETYFQYYDDEDTLVQFARLSKVYTSLSPYTKHLAEEAVTKGTPLQRPLFMHYEQDKKTYDYQYQYMYGADLLVAPVYSERKSSWTVYLPEDNWIHMWTGEKFTGGEVTISATIGNIPVFYKADSEFKELFASIGKL